MVNITIEQKGAFNVIYKVKQLVCYNCMNRLFNWNWHPKR